MPNYSVMYSIERSGTITFTADDDAHDSVEDSNQSFYELRNGQGKQLSD